MIRSLRNRFIAGAMFAFIILLVLLIAGTAGFGYLHLQYQKHSFLDEALATDIPSRGMSQAAEPYFFADGDHHSHDERPAASHCLIDFDNEGKIIRFYSDGMRTVSMDQLKAYLQKIYEKNSDDGEVDGYIYRIRNNDTGRRIVIMDFCLQEDTYHSMLRLVITLGLGCTVLLLLILIPVSKRVAQSYASHIEKQRQFITNAGHDLKTPVAIIRSNVDAQELINGENKWSGNIREQAVRLNRLIEQMLTLARMEESRFRAPMSRIDFAELLKNELEIYHEIFKGRQLRLNTEIDAPADTMGNHDSLLQLVHILLDNAAQYANPGGMLTVSLRKKSRRILLRVENTVEALPDCPPKKLFDRFFRGDSARTQKTGGSGIGLAAAQNIAWLHRGRIEAIFNENPSVAFVVELPLRQNRKGLKALR